MRCETEQKNKNSNCMVAFIFDSGRFSTSVYEKEAIGAILRGRELKKNQSKIVVSTGDILCLEMCVDISPYVIPDEMCSIHWETIIDSKSSDPEKGCKIHGRMKDYPFAIVLEDVEKEIVHEIDKRIHQECKAYIGVTSINIESKDQRKQFWKHTIRTFSLEGDICTVFGVSEAGNFFKEEIIEAGYEIRFDGFSFELSLESTVLFSTRQSSFIQNKEQLQFAEGKNDSARGKLNMNFALVKEVEIAGVEILKAIEDINKVYLSKDSKDIIIDYIFTSFYQAAQGIERLLKILIEMVSYSERNMEKEKTDKLLYSHNHVALADDLEKKSIVKFDRPCRKLLQTLNMFYAEARYSRYIDCVNDKLELDLLGGFGDAIGEDDFNEEFKKMYGKILGKVSRKIYKAIDDLCSKMGIYVSEINSSSIACVVFWNSYEENLYKSLLEFERAKKEILWYLICNGEKIKNKYSQMAIPPLSFDDSGINEFISEMIKGNLSETDIQSQIEVEYEQLDLNKNELKTRFEFLDYLFDYDHFLDDCEKWTTE